MGSRGRAGLVLIAVFAAGLLGGVALERHLFGAAPRVATPREAHAAAMSDLVEALDLDQEQTARVHEIIASNHRVVQGAWEELRPRVQNAMTNVNREIAGILRPDQRQRFHDWLEARAEHGSTFTFHER